MTVADLIDYYLPAEGSATDYHFNRYHETTGMKAFGPPAPWSESPYTSGQFLVARLQGPMSASVPQGEPAQEEVADAFLITLLGTGPRPKWLKLDPRCDGAKGFLAGCEVDFSSLQQRFKLQVLCRDAGSDDPMSPKSAFTVWRITSYYRHRNAYMLQTLDPGSFAVRLEDTDSSISPDHSIRHPESCAEWAAIVSNRGITGTD